MMGNILMIKNSFWLSRFIRWITKSDYDHVAIFMNDKYIIEADLSGVKKTPFEFYKNRVEYKILSVKNISDFDRYVVVEYAKAQIGKSYDYIQLICMGFFYLIKKLRKIEPIDLSGWVCSELVAESFYEIGIKFSESVDPDNITPKDIYTSSIVKEVK